MADEPTPPAPYTPPPPDLPQASPPPPLIERTPAVTPSGPPPLWTGAKTDSPVAEPEEDEAESARLAPFNTRIVAALIDVVVAFGLEMAALSVLPIFATRTAWLLAVGYFVTRDSLPFLGGQSVGKKAMKLKVVTADDRLLTGNWEAALIRNGVLIIPLFAFIELFILLSREDKPGRGLRLGDEWAKTRVILAPDPPPAG